MSKIVGVCEQEREHVSKRDRACEQVVRPGAMHVGAVGVSNGTLPHQYMWWDKESTSARALPQAGPMFLQMQILSHLIIECGWAD